MPGAVVSAFPADIQDTIQQGFLSMAWREALVPQAMHRREATRMRIILPESGESVRITRDGLPTPNPKPVKPGAPTPEVTYTKEQFDVVPQRWKGKKTTNLVNSAFEKKNRFLRDSRQLAIAAGWSIDRASRNAWYAAYGGGDTLSVASAASGQNKVYVAALAGFRFATSSTGVLTPVSSSIPLSVTVKNGATVEARQVVQVIPDDAEFPNGPGYLVLEANLVNTFAARSRVYAANKPYQALPGTAATIDDLTGSSVVTYTQFLEAIRVLTETNVPKFSDGTYHCMLDTAQKMQFLNDAALRQFLQGVPDSAEAKMAVISQRLGITFIDCNECPRIATVSMGTKGLVSGGNATQAPEVGCEVVNNAGVPVRRSLIYGMDSLMEGYVEEMDFKAQTQGREGSFGYDGAFLDSTGSLNAMLEGLRLHIRPAIDDHGEEVTQAYSLTADFVCPTDWTGFGSAALYKRAVLMLSAGPS